MIYQGIFKPNQKGFGFVTTDEKQSIFIPPKLAKKYFAYDVLEVKASLSDDTQKWEIEDINVLAAPYRRIAGTLDKKDEVFYFIPENPTISPYPVWLKSEIKPEDKYKAIGTAKMTPQGWSIELEQIFNPEEPGWESKISLALHHVPANDKDYALVKSIDNTNRIDLTKKEFITIDSASTRDIDDAICVDEAPNGYNLYVAIADASEYVVENSELDKDALERGTSVYMNQKMIPMLPHSISSQAGSLLPNQKKPVLVCQMNIDLSGNIQKVDLYQATIESKDRLTYDEVTDCVDNKKEHKHEKQLNLLKGLYFKLLEKRVLRGSMPIRDGDYSLRLNDKQKVTDIKKNSWHISYGMIEEAMLAANTSVASWLIKNKIPSIYRHHKGPDNNAWSENKSYLEALGIEYNDTPLPHMLKEMSLKASSMGHSFGIENAIRSAMRPASYQSEHQSHFSLAYELYTHFTSPLRRYADLTVHRTIKKFLNFNEKYSNEGLTEIALKCSAADQRAKKVSREEEKRLVAEFISTKIGMLTEAIIVGGNGSGIIIRGVEYPFQSFIPLPQTYKWNNSRQELISIERTLIAGEKIQIKIEDVDLKNFRIVTSSNEFSISKENDIPSI